jgi:hypothetical protein
LTQIYQARQVVLHVTIWLTPDLSSHDRLSMLGEDSPQLVLGLEEEEEGEEERKDSVKAEKRFAGSGQAYGGEEREEKCREEPAREEEEKEEEERRCKERRPQANKGPTLVSHVCSGTHTHIKLNEEI